MDGFKLLASNYLNIEGDHELYREIEGLLKKVEVTPAEIAEELLKKDDPDVSYSLRGIVEFLEEKNFRMQCNKACDWFVDIMYGWVWLCMNYYASLYGYVVNRSLLATMVSL